MPSKSQWMTQLSMPTFPVVTRDVSVDVVVIGGGITGITAAYLLNKSGRTVALVERDRYARADTGHTTAHLSYVTDERLQDLIATFGRDHAAAAWDAGRAAIRQIQTIVEENAIDCNFEPVPGYLHASWKDADDKVIESLRKDAELAKEFGFDAHSQDRVEFANRPGVRFDDQARFHPLRATA